jgi:hypothetical protein
MRKIIFSSTKDPEGEYRTDEHGISNHEVKDTFKTTRTS